MPRSLVLGNGNLLATFDKDLLLRDFYYPYIGEEDHTTYGHKHRVGFFVEGNGFSWLDDGSWKIDIAYASETLVGNARAINDKLGLQIDFIDYVSSVKNILMRHLIVHNLDDQKKEVRMYFNHDLHLYGDKQKDTAFYEPESNSVIHYRKTRYFLVGGYADGQGLTSYTTGKSEFRELEGTWRDAEDGNLHEHPVEQGSVDSTVELTCHIEPKSQEHAHLWICAGKHFSEVINLQEYIHDETPEQMERSTKNYWKSWVYKQHQTFGSLDDDLIDLFKRSLLIVRTQADNRGGILAANDSDIMQFNRDTYSYVWPRDGAFICIAMDKAGYMEISRRFFQFCCNAQTDEGYLIHKYNPDGSPGSSWHPWFRDGEVQLPIQEDETALVLHAMWLHFEHFHDFEWLQNMYESFVKKAGDFLVAYREKDTHLPLPTYDPWEEHRGIFSYTCATTYAGLLAASKISHALGHSTHFHRYQDAADEVRQAILFHLFDEETGRFVKKIKRSQGKQTEKDTTPDASICHLWSLGLLPPDDNRIVSTMTQLEESLRVRTPVGGYARYPRDFYHFTEEHSDEVPGNPWIITTLWLAQWKIELAKSLDDLKEPHKALRWTLDQASKTGILPEQMHPITGEPLSVAPLTWSHAVYVETFLQYLQKEIQLRKGAQKTDNQDSSP